MRSRTAKRRIFYLEVDGSVAVLVDGVEDVVRVVAAVALREELRVDLLEGRLVDDATRTFLLESAVNELNLLLGEARLLHELFDRLGLVADGGGRRIVKVVF